MHEDGTISTTPGKFRACTITFSQKAEASDGQFYIVWVFPSTINCIMLVNEFTEKFLRNQWVAR